ncbi:MAG: hypothetical protein ACRD4G_08435, partial [Bryobacteraceae bacterium]
FSGPVNAASLANGMFVVPLTNGTPGNRIPVQQIIFDPTSRCVFAEPTQVLHQRSQYLLIVTSAVQDAGGAPVAASPQFSACLGASGTYCQNLAGAVAELPPTPSDAASVVSASLFTTMSTTSWLERARNYVNATEFPIVLPAGLPFSFRVSNIQSMQWIPSDTDIGPQDIPVSALSGVGKVAFGFFLSPNFLSSGGAPAGTIPVTPTGDPIPLPSRFAVPISFHVFLPATPPPPGGYPVVIYGHGLGDSQFGAPTYIASTMAQHGFATLAFEVTGHGYGKGGKVEITERGGRVDTVATPGRGVMLPGNTQIGPTDGCIIPGPVGIRDCMRQTAVDLIALYDTIKKTHGMLIHLNPQRVYYVGQSLGSIYGTLFAAMEPGIQTAVLSGDGGSEVDIARLSISGRPLAIAYLQATNPALFNVKTMGAPLQPYFHPPLFPGVFNGNYVFPGSAPVTNAVPGAMAVQAAFAAADWLDMPGDALSYAPLLPQHVLFQFGYGDLEVPNSTESAVVRAADGQAHTWFFNFAKAAGINPALPGITMDVGGTAFPILPHRILSNPTVLTAPGESPLAFAEQRQAAAYFASDGQSIVDPDQFLNGTPYANQDLFTDPAVLPEGQNFLQVPPSQPGGGT